MKKTAQSCLLTAMVLAATASRAGEDSRGVLPSGLGDEIDRAVAELREATAPFRAIDAALAAGYKQETDCVERPNVGGMGYHFTNAALRDGLVELRKPEVLVYGKRADGSFQLNGVEYIVPTESWSRSEPPAVLGQPMKRFDAAGIWYLHMWIWEPSPAGLFADWNPRVKCPPKSD
jgi:hypothetical protein